MKQLNYLIYHQYVYSKFLRQVKIFLQLGICGLLEEGYEYI